MPRATLLFLAWVGARLVARDYARVRQSFCSISRAEATSRSPQRTYILGTATTDSVMAGYGTFKRAASDAPAVFGQRVRVDSLGATTSRDLDGLRSEAQHDVIIVPWDFDAACRPYRWTSSAIWVAPGRTSFFVATLRNRQYWAADVPTFDVDFASLQPYPQRVEGFREPIPALTAAEMFSMNESLPIAGDTSENRYAAFALWQSRHPDLATKFPASAIGSAGRKRR